MNSALNRTGLLSLTNTSGSQAAYGDVGVLDTANSESWRHETSGSSPARLMVGVVYNRGGVAVNGRGLFAASGYIPRVNLVPGQSANVGDYLKLSTTHGKAQRSATAGAGDFAQALTSGSAPSAWAFGFPLRA